MADIQPKKEKPESQAPAAASTAPASQAAVGSLQTPQADTALEVVENIIIADDQKKPGRTKTTAGEHVHKWGTYLSVDWVLNAAAGVSFSYWGKYSQLGQKFWSGPITSGFKKALSARRPLLSTISHRHNPKKSFFAFQLFN